MTRTELLEVVYRFYPRGLYAIGLGYHDTEERQRQRDAVRRGAAEFPTWSAMLRRLGARYPLMDHTTYGGGVGDSAYSASIVIPGRTLGFHVSWLGPYYGIHRTGLPAEEAAALDLAREIEATYRGYEPIPPELGDEVVPDVTLFVKDFGEATVFHLLLSDSWDTSSEPWPPPPCVPRTEAELEARRARALEWSRRSGCSAMALPPKPIPRELANEPPGYDPSGEAGEPSRTPSDPSAEGGEGE